MPVYILAAARTPIGAFGGCLKTLSAPELGAHALRETLRRGGIDPARVDEVILGCALPCGSGGNPAHAAAIAAGVSAQAPTLTVCAGAASGLQAVALAAQNLQHGTSAFALAGGFDSPSQAPYLLPGARWGVRIGEAALLDSLLLDAPPVEREAEALSVSAESRVAWTARSRQRSTGARPSRDEEIAPLVIPGRKGPLTIREDEPPEASRLAPDLAPPADGAAALLLASAIPAGTPALAQILDWSRTGSDTGTAVRQLLAKLGLGFDQIDRWEIHEPSAAHVLALLADLPEIDPARVNVAGGALALGDPPGASGARLLAALAFGLRAERLRTGVAVVPASQGLGIAMAITRI